MISQSFSSFLAVIFEVLAWCTCLSWNSNSSSAVLILSNPGGGDFGMRKCCFDDVLKKRLDLLLESLLINRFFSLFLFVVEVEWIFQIPMAIEMS